VADGALGARHRRFLPGAPQEPPQRRRLGTVAGERRGAVGVDRVDVGRIEAGIGDGAAQRQLGAGVTAQDEMCYLTGFYYTE
jgi:hypothetical protein